MTDEFQSLSKGVFVVPFEPPDGPQAGPSRPKRPLADLYSDNLKRCQAAYEAHEADRTAEQLDDIADWLDRCARPPLLTFPFPLHRLPVAIIQSELVEAPSVLLLSSLPDEPDISASLSPLFPTLTQHVHTLHGREASDLASAVRSLAVGFVGEGSAARRTGRSGLDEIEEWWKGQKERSPLLLHIEQAQLVPATVLAELTYILTLRTDLPIRLLLSVPSTATFLSSWTHVEPSLIDLSIIQSGRGRKKGGAMEAILKTAQSTHDSLLHFDTELADEIKRMEDLTGGGAALALKALKWSLLRHSVTSPLAHLANGPDRIPEIRALIGALRQDPAAPGSEVFSVHSHKDLGSVLDPAPRISILHALAQPHDFTKSTKSRRQQQSPADRTEEVISITTPLHIRHSLHNGEEEEGMPGSTRAGSGRKRRRVVSPSATPPASPGDEPELGANGFEEPGSTGSPRPGDRGDLKELETLFSLWRSAGRSVNLWDWLEGFRGSMHPPKTKGVGGEGVDDGIDGAPAGTDIPSDEGQAATIARKGDAGVERVKALPDIESERGDGGEKEDEEEDEETAARLHAAFVRFCEEARMMGLVRARGKGVGRRGDEVVKGVGLV